MSDGNVWSYVVGAYAVTWVGLIGYALRLAVLHRRAKATAEMAAAGGER